MPPELAENEPAEAESPPSTVVVGNFLQCAVCVTATIAIAVIVMRVPLNLDAAQLLHQLRPVAYSWTGMPLEPSNTTIGNSSLAVGNLTSGSNSTSNTTGSSIVAHHIAANESALTGSGLNDLSSTTDKHQCGQLNSPACPACPAAQTCGKQRVRKNFLALSTAARRTILAAMDIIKLTSWAEGLADYGPKFKPYDYFVQRHAQAQSDPQSDRAHGGPWFVPYHRLFVLEYEEVLLAVNPSIEALPYWDVTQGYAGVLGAGELEFGSPTGTGEHYTVTDGYFGHWTVSHLNDSLANASGNSGYYRGNANSEIRSALNNPPTDSITRYPSCTGPSVTKADFDRCAGLVGTIDDYQRCLSERRTPYHGSLHSEVHMWLGSRTPLEDASCSIVSGQQLLLGDFFDVTTSVNDPIWMLHHANIDRATFHFTLTNNRNAATYHGYRAAAGRDMWFDLAESPTKNGLLLLDVVTQRQPFMGSDLGLHHIGGPSGKLTVADSLCWIGPTSGLYSYDTVVPAACGASSAQGE